MTNQNSTSSWSIGQMEKPIGTHPIASHFEVVSQRLVGDRYAELIVQAPEIAARFLPGQFAMISPALPGGSTPTLPRPMAIYDSDADERTITFVYGIVGSGTAVMSRFHSGQKITIVGPLGIPFTIDPTSQNILLIGRGIGICSVAPIIATASEQKMRVTVVNSARSPEALIGNDLFKKYGAETLIAVTDSQGNSGVDSVRSKILELGQSFDQIFVCGSSRLASLALDLAEKWNIPAQISIEANMACGIGYCHGCASGKVGSTDESPLVCVDGPVFRLIPAT